MNLDAKLAGLSSRQNRAFSRQQALATGFSRQQIEHRLESGVWTQLDTQSYAIAGAPATWERQLRAAILSRPTAYAAGRSAAVLHEFPFYSRSKPEIVVPFPGNARSPIAKVIRNRYFETVEKVHVKGFPATSVAETIYTLSQREPRQMIERLIDDQLASRSLKIEDFDVILDRLADARVRGLPALRRAIAARDKDGYQPPTSELERLLYRLLDSPELPTVSHQVPLRLPTTAARVDAFINDWGLIIEADGRRWHTREQDFERDRERDNAATEAGLAIIRFTYSMLKREPAKCLDTVLKAGTWRRSA